MTRARHWLIFILLLLPLAGCPIIEQVRTFTSADVNSNGALDGDAEGGEGEGESPGTDTGGGEEREVVEPDVIRRVVQGADDD